MSRAPIGKTMPEITEYTAADLEAAAGLLAQRQVRLRAVRPELPESFTQPDACLAILERLMAEPGAYGVMAHEGGTAVAYLIGHRQFADPWGRACWSPVEGQAYAEAAGPEVMRDLYAAWSRHWVDVGVFLHYILAPADDPALLEAWFSLNFGKMQAHGVATTEALAADGAPGFNVRRMETDNMELARPLLDLIARAQLDSPAYAVSLPERFNEFNVEEYLDPDDPGRVWLAVEGDRALGLAGFWEAHPGPMVPDGAWELGAAMTLPDARGRGVQRALLATAFAEARQTGVGHVITDWRTANLLSSRTWPRLGFRPTQFRLHRRIDDRVAWTSAPAPRA